MTKARFLIQAQLYYYLEHDEDNPTSFSYLDDKVKKMVIKEKDGLRLFPHEFKYFLSYCTDKQLKKYYTSIINEGEDITTDELESLINEGALTDERILLWYNMLKKAYTDDGYIEDWEKFYAAQYNLFIAKMRDKRIDSILKD